MSQIIDAVEEKRASILEAAASLLTEEGFHALSLRRIAAQVGTSTQAIYTLFGGKEGLMDALFIEGFRRLGAAIEAVPTEEDPQKHVLRLAQVYRETALTNRKFYAVTFGRLFPASSNTQQNRQKAWEPFHVLVEALRKCGVADPAKSASALWSASHGVVSLELAGMLTPIEAQNLITHLVLTIMVPKSDIK